ncbi:MAG: hypothetical protein K1X64_13465 [Myxococcaceae bacterium]|nr:hypothetical protein [Myxococcaceae bacterium]
MTFIRRTAAMMACLWALQAGAGSVYLNNVNIDGVTGQKFEKATVRIDEKGNVFIDAPGYAVRQVEGTPKTVPGGGGTLTQRYFMVTEQTAVGMTEYDIDVYINAKWVRKLRSGDDPIVTEITRHLVPGKNVILVQAKKVGAKEARKSFSSDHIYRVIVGAGNMSGDHVMIDSPQVKFERNASQSDDVSQEFVLTTR